ncbi:Gfo/Idh/MocA family protein [Pseudoroseicyclus tamaricis]|uniref:Gfo/Idh/MocA family oxidoreductase n=1 Tax=Pseudoroseicyclus tamaricis TaxID=2705421 RepID=A0A6B2JVH3_9RHOB|nr:Gfo/Idh/MocA family oxidoreductase [Pseudoroseicyclus tamaricis]NDV00184.1 Gfo/Idh/MocA family oxidoreductase [Pseudoroseicyclus tamaricis]
MSYALVGTGARHKMFTRAVTETFGTPSDLLGLCDSNTVRLTRSAASVPESGNGVATYAAEDFDRMLAEQKPSTVIVTVPDNHHHDYIVRALHAGCDVVTEKPMTMDLEKLKAILDAQEETGRKVTVTFNYRYTPARTQLKDILMKGTIGEITAVDFRWHLDRVHGADYFRRWHRNKENSGGLLVHKATHHFDLMNWWLGSEPVTVQANGQRGFYTPQMAAELGLADHGPRCQECDLPCDYRLDIAADEALRELYLEAEGQDGYIRDKCVFDADITIEDLMQLSVAYRSGATMTYSLCAYSPWEGLEILFYGTKGTLSHRHVEVHGVFGGKRDVAVRDNMETTLHLAGQPPQKIDVWHGEGDHGGADPVMLGYLFDEGAGEDPYGRTSTHVDGAWSILTGIAGNRSIAEGGRTVEVDAMLAEAGIRLPRA